MKIIKNQSVAQSMKLTVTEKDMLNELKEKITEKDLINFYIDYLANKSEHRSDNLKSLAYGFGIKASWAYTAHEIGKKLMFKEISKIKRMKRDTPKLEAIV